MTEGQYWDGDNWLPKAYREAEKMRQERFNHEAWLQGMYIYDAIARLSPVLRAFGKKGTKAEPYVERPYPLTPEAVEDAETRKAKRQERKGFDYMMSKMIAINRKFAVKGSESDADDNRSVKS